MRRLFVFTKPDSSEDSTMFGVRKALVSILVLAFVFPARCLDALAREWTDTTGKYRVEADFVEATDDGVQIKKTNGEVVNIPLEKLSEADRRYVRYKVGLATVDLTGIWQTDEGAIYRFEDDGETISAKALESRVISSLDAKLRHDGAKVVADRWKVVFREDPSRQHRNLKVDLYLTMEGQVRVGFEEVHWDRRGREIGRKRQTTRLSKISEQKWQARLARIEEQRQLARERKEKERENFLIGVGVLLYGLGKLAEIGGGSGEMERRGSYQTRLASCSGCGGDGKNWNPFRESGYDVCGRCGGSGLHDELVFVEK